MTGSIHIEKIPAQPSVERILNAFRDESFLILLDSATSARSHDSRYTFLTADPVDVAVILNCSFGDDPFRRLRDWQGQMAVSGDSELPPFRGGIAGLMSYDLGNAFERLPGMAPNGFSTPVLAAGLFDWAIVWDHLLSTVAFYVIPVASGTAEKQAARVEWIRRRLDSAGLRADTPETGDTGAGNPGRDSGNDVSGQSGGVVGSSDVTYQSSFSRSEYLSAVQKVIDYIAAGDIYQVNLSQQLTAPWAGSGSDLYQRVRTHNAAPFCGLFQTPEFSVVSASPERFLKVRQGCHVETRPIKGTRRRQQSPIADLYTADELSTSEKDRAENVMIVDLLRNDISRVCEIGSVEVTGVCEIEVFETVQHLVSTVVGKLRPDCDIWDLCAACFPGGSITGAPKLRAMEIIAELEQTSRGAYCGSLFYCGPDNDFDSSILIRTFVLSSGRVVFPVGGGVVADSVPQDEFDETLHKASGMLRSLRSE
ncbi:MAG: aminodeoxychorismate synthase component I [Fuerstiella sp.]|nr:aminodeoxychorismate synthase component I [Fuerstiella sp.]